MSGWTTFAQGRIYRPVMRMMHRLGWCYPELVDVEPNVVWCQWCGMRGRTVPKMQDTPPLFRRVRGSFGPEAGVR